MLKSLIVLYTKAVLMHWSLKRLSCNDQTQNVNNDITGGWRRQASGYRSLLGIPCRNRLCLVAPRRQLLCKGSFIKLANDTLILPTLLTIAVNMYADGSLLANCWPPITRPYLYQPYSEVHQSEVAVIGWPVQVRT